MQRLGSQRGWGFSPGTCQRTTPGAVLAVCALGIAVLGTHPGEATVMTSTLPQAPGTYVWVGEHRLHLNCVGTGSPTVVFDSGLGGNSLDWVRVQPLVGNFTRACSYDRAGYGWSDAGPKPRDSVNISRELEQLLGNASVPAPYLMVGHSFGGLNVRLYSHKNPDKVAGLVLVDSSHENQFRLYEEAGVGAIAPRAESFILRNPFRVPLALPESVMPTARSLAVTRRSTMALRSELRNLRRSANQLRQAHRFPDVPVVVISHRIEQAAASDVAIQRAKIWMGMQSELAGRASQGHHVIASTTDHYVHLREPELVAEAVKQVIARSN